MPPFNFKAYDVIVTGFPTPRTFYAPSPGKARAKAWQAYTSYNPECSFREFLSKSTIQRSGAPLPKDFGKKILVSGKPAYRIGGDSQYVHFIWPGEDVILYSHPLDVEPCPEDEKEKA